MERIQKALDRARQERGDAKYKQIVTSTPGTLGTIRYTKTRTLHIAPKVLNDNRIITGSEQDIYADSYKILRTRVLQRLSANDWNVLAVTSPNPGAGKTLTAINLALSISLEVTKTVLLVDADLRCPSVHTYFGQKTLPGLSDHLLDDIPLENLLVHPDIGKCVILPGGRAVLANSAELLTSPKMATLVDEMKNRYPARIIIFDLPPVLAVADTLAFAPYIDATLLIVEDGVTQQEDLARSIELLQQTPIIGTVLNKSSEIPQGYGYS